MNPNIFFVRIWRLSKRSLSDLLILSSDWSFLSHMTFTHKSITQSLLVSVRQNTYAISMLQLDDQSEKHPASIANIQPQEVGRSGVVPTTWRSDWT